MALTQEEKDTLLKQASRRVGSLKNVSRFLVFGGALLLIIPQWIYIIHMASTMEKAKLGIKYCNSKGMEVSTVRYKLLEKSLQYTESNKFFITLTVLSTFGLILMLGSQYFQSFWWPLVWVLLGITVVVFLPYLFMMNKGVQVSRKYYTTTLVLSAVFAAASVIMMAYNENGGPRQTLLVLPSKFSIAIIFAAYIPFLIFPVIIDKMTKPLLDYEREYLAKSHAVFKTMAKSSSGYDAAYLPYDLRRNLIENIKFYHPEMSDIDAVHYLTQMISSTNPLYSPIIYMRGELNIDVQYLERIAPELHTILTDPRYRYQGRLSSEIQDTVKWARKTMIPFIIFLSIATVMFLSYVYHALDFDSYTMMVVHVGIALFLMAVFYFMEYN